MGEILFWAAVLALQFISIIGAASWGARLYCGSFLRFGDALKLRLLTLEQVGELKDDERSRLVRLRKYTKDFRLRRGVSKALEDKND